MHGNDANSLLAGLLGLVVGSAAVRIFSEYASLAISVGTMAAIAAAAFAALTDREVTRVGAIGGGVGLLAGGVLAAVDALYL